MIRKRKLSIKKLIAFTFTILCFILFIYSSIHIFKWYINNKENAKIKEKINKVVIVEQKDDVNKEDNKYNINFIELKKINSDTVAYLKVPNTNIDYIVVKGKDNSYYLKKNFEKKWNVAGWIFADFRNKFDGTDRNIVIYGHNMKDGSMFGSLKKILNKEWYENPENQKIVLVTENGNNIYQVFSIYYILAEDYYISTDFNNNIEYKEFLDTIKKRSIYDFKIELTEEDKILTLSTCMPNGKDRLVLHAKKQ